MVETNLDQQKKKGSENQVLDLKDLYRSAIFRTYREFHKLSEDEQAKFNKDKSLSGRKAMLDSFWHYFNEKHTEKILEKIDKETFQIYFDTIKKDGFTVEQLIENESLQDKVKSEDTELHTIFSTLKSLKKYSSHLGPYVFRDFAGFAGFDADSFVLNPVSKLENLADLYEVWEDFLLTPAGLALGLNEAKKSNVKNILNPDFDYSEKMLISSIITKVSDNLTDPLKTYFDGYFYLPLNALHPIQTLRNFKVEWNRFLTMYSTFFDEDLVKKLNGLVITNENVKSELISYGLESYQGSMGSFSKRSNRYKSIFGKLISVKHFEDIHKSQDMLDESVDQIYGTFKNLNPYVNEIFKIYSVKSDYYSSKRDTPNRPQIFLEMDKIQDETIDLNGKSNHATSEAEKNLINSKIKELEQKFADMEWEYYISNVEEKNSELGKVMRDLYSKKFDFSLLTQEQQQVIVDVLIENKIDGIVKHKVPNLLGVDETEFKQFIYKFFDLSDNDLSIPTPSGDIDLFFDKKELLGGAYQEVPAISSLASLKNLPLNFILDLDNDKNSEARKMFENSELWQNLYTSFGKNKFHQGYKVKIKGSDGISYSGYLGHHSEVDKKGVEEFGWQLYTHPLNVPSNERSLVKDAKGNPLTILDKDVDDYDFQIIEKKLNINGDLLGQVLFGYAVGSSSFPKPQISDGKASELDDKFGKMLGYQNESKVVDNAKDAIGDLISDPGQSPNETNEGDTEEQKFMKKWKSLGGYNFNSDNNGFERGTKIFIKIGQSDLPPKNSLGGQWMNFEIVDIEDGKFKVKMSGGELKLNPSEWEGKQVWLPIKEKTLQNRESAFGQSNMFKLPAMSNNSFQQQLDIISSSSMGTKGLGVFENDVSFNSNGFKFKSNRTDGASGKVQYFGITDVIYNTGSPDVSQQNILYEVKPTSGNRINVKSKFVGDKDGKKVSFKYDKDMSYYDFILFVSGKGLKPQNDKQIAVKKAIQEKEHKAVPQNLNGGASWFSLGNVFDFFKNTKDKIKEKIESYNKDKTEDLTDLLVTQKGIFKKMSGLFGSNFFPSMEDAFTKMQVEFDKDRDTRVWNKIQYWLDLYTGDPHFDTLYKKEIEPILRGEKSPMDKYQMPAALIAMVKKGGPFNRGAKDLMGSGIWVRHLLGEDHFQRFKGIREEVKQRMHKEYENYVWIHAESSIDELVKLEIEYIKDTVDGRRHSIKGPKADELFWSGTWSRKFAVELGSAHDKLFSQADTDEKYNEISGAVTFDFAAYQYNRFIKSGRPHHALPFIKKMAETMRTSNDRLKFTGYVVATMLSGMPLNVWSKNNRQYFQKVCRSIGVLPGILIRDLNHQSDMFRMLKVFTKGRFSEDIIYNLPSWLGGGSRKYNILDYQHEYMPEAGDFIEGFVNNRWMGKGNGQSISKFLELKNPDLLELLDSKDVSDEDKKILMKLKGKSLEGTQEDIDPDITPNFFAYADDPLNLNKSVIKPFIKNISNKQFQGETYQIEAAEEFWNATTTQIPNFDMSNNKSRLAYMVEKFFNWFDMIYDPAKKTQLARALATAQYLKKSGRKTESDDVIRYMIKGEVLAYFKGVPGQMKNGVDKFYEMFLNNLDVFDDGFISKTFGSDFSIDFKHPYKYINQDDYEQTKVATASTNKPELLEKKVDLEKREIYLNPIIYNLKWQLSGINENRYSEEDLKKYGADVVDGDKEDSTLDD